MVAWSATFPGTDGVLPPTDEGLPFSVVRGSVSLRSGRGYAQPTSPGPFAVVQSGTGGNNGRLVSSFPSASAYGQALYFRVVDVNNYWRLGLYGYSTTTQVQTGTRYYWRQDYASHPDGDVYQNHFQTATTDVPNGSTPVAPAFPDVLYHNHYHHPYAPDSDIITHGHHRSGSAYVTGTEPLYSTSSSTHRELRLTRVVAGRLSTVAGMSTAGLTITGLVAEFSGPSIEGSIVTASGARPLPLVTDSTHQSATLAGFGYDEANSVGGFLGVDSVTYRLPEGQSGSYGLSLIL